ncbi:MAG TPA: (2Fe-2S)-binding protein [Pseudonocardia sp.]|nr:(2Fe-2S)-binding protein [Pseudonocardia sp.]
MSLDTDPQVAVGEAARTEVEVALTVNGERRELTVDARRSLVDVLRRDLRLTGTNVGCEEGVCGACTVLVDGEPARSCLLLAAQADGSVVETVESLARDGRLGPLQRAFHEHHGLQCGFCTPGFLMLATALLRTEPRPGREQVRACVSANLCRCTGYEGVIDAVCAAAEGSA